LEWDGREVVINGELFVLQCRSREIRYPYPQLRIDVWATMKDRKSKAYRDVAKLCKDDWGYSILDMNTEQDLQRLCDIEAQLVRQDAPQELDNFVEEILA
jgi:hypothetical protein